MRNFSIIIPAYNASSTIADVLKRIPQNVWNEVENVVVVDDGSQDLTAQIVSDFTIQNTKIQLLRHHVNMGYGAALKTAIAHIEKNSSVNPAFVVCLHSDGQYPPEMIFDLIDFASSQKLDLVQGSRHKNHKALQGGMPFYKFVAGKVLVKIENTVLKLNLSDYHSGYLVYTNTLLKKIPYQNFSNSFDFDFQLIVAARIQNLGIGEIAIPTHYGTEHSYLNPIKYGLKLLWILAQYLLRSNKFGAKGSH